MNDYTLPDGRLICGDVFDALALLEPESVQCVVTSPPYWGLRRYSGEQERVWGGVEGCEHEWIDATFVRNNDQTAGAKQRTNLGAIGRDEPVHNAFCSCGAWRGAYGLEPTPEMWVEHTMDWLRSVRRVLRDDGLLWLNLGQCYQDEELVDLVAMLDPHWKPNGWKLRKKIVWCLSGGVKLWVRSQKGVMPMSIKDMARLRPETLELWDGEKWNQIAGWSEQSQGDAYEIELRSGEKIGCTPHHQWPTQRGLITTSELQVGDVIASTKLPDAGTDNEPDMIPAGIGWFIGMYIAEGSRSGRTIQMTSHRAETERFVKLQELARMYGGTCRMHITSENGATINLESEVLNGILDTYINGNGAIHKRLRTAAWQRSNAFLQHVLMGYLEGDGHWEPKNNRWRLGMARNYGWAEDMRSICALLGYSIRLRLSHAKAWGYNYKTFRGEIRFSPEVRRRPDTEIMRIGKSRGRKFWHIGLSEEPHQFALASGVLTSNSKPNPMPESVQGTRWEQHRMKLGGKGTKGPTPAGWDTQHKDDPAQGRYDNSEASLEWADCPGCAECSPNDGLILRKGSWRPTSSYEEILMLAKGPGYFADGEDVREPARDWGTRERLNFRGGTEDPLLKHYGFKDGNAAATGRNLRDVWTFPTQPMDWELCQACHRVYSGKDYRKLGRGQGPSCPDDGVALAWDGSVLFCGECSQTWTQAEAKKLPKARRCSCGAEEWLSHFAAFPQELVHRCILSSTAEKVCAACGEPWARVVEHHRRDVPQSLNPKHTQSEITGLAQPGWRDFDVPQAYSRTIGFRPQCNHDAPARPVIVLDPFGGSGTVSVVARSLGRHHVYIDVSEEYTEMARGRLTMTQPALVSR